MVSRGSFELQINTKAKHKYLMRYIEIVESYMEVDKFWIDSRNGLYEPLPEDGDQEHETDLPGDGQLSFQQAIDAGWVRGGYKHGRDSSIYLQGRDSESVRKALKRILDLYAPETATVEWPHEFARLEGREMDRFIKTGRTPR